MRERRCAASPRGGLCLRPGRRCRPSHRATALQRAHDRHHLGPPKPRAARALRGRLARPPRTRSRPLRARRPQQPEYLNCEHCPESPRLPSRPASATRSKNGSASRPLHPLRDRRALRTLCHPQTHHDTPDRRRRALTHGLDAARKRRARSQPSAARRTQPPRSPDDQHTARDKPHSRRRRLPLGGTKPAHQ
jgi:hypothetical protein